MGNALDPI